MTKKEPISGIQNIWFDSEQVDDSDLKTEQEYNNSIQSGLINNHIGSGVLAETVTTNIIFDSLLHSGLLDGTNVQPQNQPTDTTLGNQLEVELTESKVTSKRTVKVCIIGLDFQGNLQYERFEFKVNEKQNGTKHFVKVLLILFNDFIGVETTSFNLGGRIVIRESNPFSLSRNAIMASQDVMPNLFFRDFFTTTTLSLNLLLNSALPLYNVNNLNITTIEKTNYALLKGDVSSQIGQKFLATTNNIQKISLLLSVKNSEPGSESDLAWQGDIIISVYPLQTAIDCPTDIVPDLLIDFSPSNIPLAQISENYNSLLARGIVLDSVPQPVDFIFSNSSLSGGNVIVPGSYYAVTIKRSGSANKCDILVSAGNSLGSNARVTLFNGSVWTDIVEDDLWYRIWTDSAKVSDGQAYETGKGLVIPKTKLNESSGVVEDYVLKDLSFVGNDIFRAALFSKKELSGAIQDQRTGNLVQSRQQNVPDIKLLNSLDLANLDKTTETFLFGAISDKNKKSFDNINTNIVSNMHSFAMANNELLIRIIDDPTDGYRYDTSVTSLVSYLLNGDLVNAKIIPNINNLNNYFRIGRAELCSMIYGDVNGDGVVDDKDLEELNKLLGANLNLSPPLNTSIVTDGYTTTVTNGYNTFIDIFKTDTGISFQIVDPNTNLVVASGTDGVLVANPNDGSLAQFSSALVTFGNIVGLSSYKLVILTSSVQANKGSFTISGIDAMTDVITIHKLIYNSENFGKIFRADLDGDLIITSNDGYLLSNYIDKVPFQPHFTYPPPATNPYTKIGTRFNVIKLILEKYVDRTDDYTSAINTRHNDLHTTPNIFATDGYYASHNYLNQPVTFLIVKQQYWEDYLVVVNSKPRLVPTVFTSKYGFNKFECILPKGEKCDTYGSTLEFDPGRIDVFVPNNLILGDGGELQRPDGYFYKVDFEVGTITFEIPDGLFGAERTIDLMGDFIVDYNGLGTTRLGFPAMRFADCSFVTNDALAKDQIRFSVSVQSFSPNTNGLDIDGYQGAIVDGKIGVSIDHQTGFLTLNFTNLYQDNILPTLNTKVQVQVFLKKGGFNNQTLFVDSTKVKNILELISVWSGPNVGGASALVDLSNDVSGIMPIIHGGTGLNQTGVYGTVLMSSGTSLTYQFVYNLPGTISYSTGIPDANRVPKTDGYGLLDPSFYYKNPVYIYGVAGIVSHDGYTPATIGAFTFRFDKYILQGIKDIKLEAILETTNPSHTASILLFNLNTNSYIPLTGMSTTSDDAVVLRSNDIKLLLSSGATDYIYEIQLRLDPTSSIESAICKMARLVITYNNPATAPPTSANNTYNFQPFLP
jgi:hypothetical protein